jgi:hypothetical protein
MTRALTLGFLLTAAAAAASPGPRCNRGGGTILVFHDVNTCGLTGDPNEIDPWHFDGPVATPSATGAPLYTGGWRVGATTDFDGDGACDIAWTLRGTDDLAITIALSVGGDFASPGAPGQQLMGSWRMVGASDYIGLDDAIGRPTAPDHRPDLVLWSASTGELGVWATDPSGRLPGSLHTVPGRPVEWEPVVIADLDGNQVSTTSEIVWTQRPAGRLSYSTLSWRNGAINHFEGGKLDPEAPLASGWEVRAADDFNGDGREDLVFQHESSQKAVVWFMNGPQRIGGLFMTPDRLMPACSALEAEPGEYDIVGPR